MKYKLLLAYDGTSYGGWQSQHNAPSIQGQLKKALETLLRTAVHPVASGRTDSGVHALGQVAHIDCPEILDKGKTLYSLNALLSPDIRVLALEKVPPHFHARYSAMSKVYHYHIYLGKILDPLRRRYLTHISYKIDLNLLTKASHHFLGTHDFTSFANEAHRGSASHDPVRTLQRLDIVRTGEEMRLEFEGDGFLYKMVRNIVGTLLDVASFKIPLEDIPAIFAAKDRRKAGRCAPPEGLFLMEVRYLLGEPAAPKRSHGALLSTRPL